MTNADISTIARIKALANQSHQSVYVLFHGKVCIAMIHKALPQSSQTYNPFVITLYVQVLFMYKRFCAIKRGSATALSYFMVVFLIMAIFGCEEEKDFFVSRVIDGDTIELADGTRIRYIGINTPEVGQPGGKEATEANRALVESKKVRLEYDIQKQDKYGRTLAYVYLEDGTFVNAELVRLGYAQVATYPPNVKHVDLFQKLQREAQTEKRGLWASEPPKEPGEQTAEEQPPNQNQSDIVYITKTGSKYHRAGCRYLSKSAIPLTRQEAIARGYTPCSVCKP